MMISPDAASAIACLSEPAPESLVFVTLRVAALEYVLEKSRKQVTRMNKTLQEKVLFGILISLLCKVILKFNEPGGSMIIKMNGQEGNGVDGRQVKKSSV